jgi:hypothetical protein
VNDEPGGLVQDDDVFVHVEHGKRHARVRFGGADRCRLGLDADALPFSDTGARIATGTVHGDPAACDPPGELGS